MGNPTGKGGFESGQSGNPAGRPKGSRNKLTGDFIDALAEDFAKNGAAAIETVRAEDPGRYLTLIASLVPKGIEAPDLPDGITLLAHLTTAQILEGLARYADPSGDPAERGAPKALECEPN